MKKLMRIAAIASLVAMGSLRALELPCYGQPWDLTMCKAITHKADGTLSENTYLPKDKTVRSCFLAGCDPVYCSNWRENIRTVCKAEYEGMKSSLGRFFGLSQDEGKVEFEGCVTRPVATGFLGWADRLMRKMVPESMYSVCTTISPEDESILKSSLKKIWNKASEIAGKVYPTASVARE